MPTFLRRWKLYLLLLAGLVSSGIVFNHVFAPTTPASSAKPVLSPSLRELLTEKLAEVNQTLPKPIDTETTLLKVEILQDDSLGYLLKVSERLSQRFQEEPELLQRLRASATAESCRTASSRQLLSSGVILTFKYADSSEVPFFSFPVRLANCGAGEKIK